MVRSFEYTKQHKVKVGFWRRVAGLRLGSTTYIRTDGWMPEGGVVRGGERRVPGAVVGCFYNRIHNKMFVIYKIRGQFVT